MLLIKAARLFTPTNLSVVAANGQLFSIPVVYAEKPLQTVYSFDSTTASSAIIAKESFYDLKEQVLMISDNTAFIHRSVAKDLVGLRLKGIYITNNHFLFSFQLTNESNIGYDVEQLRFYIKDKHTAKRTASQETDLHPQFLTGDLKSINSQESKTFIISCPKFTIPDAKKMLIQLDEQNGGRHLQLIIHNKQLLKGRLLPSAKLH